MKKVMLIGDSIRQGYQNDLINELDGEYEVWGSAENNRFAKYTLNELERLFIEFSNSEDKNKGEFISPTSESGSDVVYPDIIHWNNGLWDTSIVYKEDGAFTPVDEYIGYMAKILRELRKVTEKIIFATTTPVRPENPNQDNNIISEYNKQIIAFMKKQDVVINDLNMLVSEDVDRFIGDDNIHLSDEGKKYCAKAAAEIIRRM